MQKSFADYGTPEAANSTTNIFSDLFEVCTIALCFHKLLWCAPRATQLVTLLIIIAAVCRLIERRLNIPTGDDPNESLVDRHSAQHFENQIESVAGRHGFQLVYA